MMAAAPRAMLRALFRDDLLRRMLRNASYLLSGTAARASSTQRCREPAAYGRARIDDCR